MCPPVAIWTEDQRPCLLFRGQPLAVPAGRAAEAEGGMTPAISVENCNCRWGSCLHFAGDLRRTGNTRSLNSFHRIEGRPECPEWLLSGELLKTSKCRGEGEDCLEIRHKLYHSDFPKQLLNLALGKTAFLHFFTTPQLYGPRRQKRTSASLLKTVFTARDGGFGFLPGLWFILLTKSEAQVQQGKNPLSWWRAMRRTYERCKANL